MLTLMVLFGLAIMELLSLVRGQLMHQVAESVDAVLAPRLFRAIFRLNQLIPGQASSQPLLDLRTLRDFLPGGAIAALPDVPPAVVFMVLLFVLSPVLGTLALVVAIVQVALAWGNERQTLAPLAQANQMSVSAQHNADDMLRNAEAVRAMGMMPALYGRWRLAQNKLLGLQAIASDRAGAYSALTKFTQTLLSSAMLGMAALLLLNNDLWGGGSMLIVGSVGVCWRRWCSWWRNGAAWSMRAWPGAGSTAFWQPCRSSRSRCHCPHRPARSRSSSWQRIRKAIHRHCWCVASSSPCAPVKRWPWQAPRAAAKARWHACW